jgi:hypothetical protein
MGHITIKITVSNPAQGMSTHWHLFVFRSVAGGRRIRRILVISEVSRRRKSLILETSKAGIGI